MLCSNIFGVVVSAILLSTVIDTQGKAYKYRAQIHGGVSHKKVIATWEEAKQRCENEGAVLASPIDNGLLEYMKESIGANNHTTPYFIGMKAVGHPELIFVSVEGVLLDNLPEGAKDMIEELDPRVGDCLSMDRYNIRVVACRARLPYLCYIPNERIETETQSRSEATTPPTTETTPEVTTQTTTEAATELTTQSRTEASTEVTTPATIEVTTEVTIQSTSPNDCGPGYKLYPTGSCYKVHLERVSWDDAQSTCASEGGYLAVINNEYESQVVGTFAFLETDSNWITIGLRDYKEDGHWTSVHNAPIDQIYNVWAESRSNDRYCGSLKKDGGKVDDQYCSVWYPFVCEHDLREITEVTTQATTEATTEVTTQETTEATTEEITQATTVASSDCGPGYKLYPTGSCYKVHLQKVYWDEARATCASEGGYLAIINNEYEAQEIGTFAFLETDSNWITIGLRDYKEDGHWTSVHNDPIDQIYNVWAESRSNDRYCGSLKKVGGKVDDQYCRATYPFVCEHDQRETTEVTTQATTESSTEVTTQATTEASTEEITQPTTVAPSDCGPGYKLYPTGSCYKVHLQKENWDEARATCASEGGYLAIINNEYEAQVVGTFAFLETDSNWITIGLRDYEEDGHWTSVHNDPIDQIYNVWAESRSNDRYCGSLKKVGGKLDDQYCGATYPFVCEHDHRETTEVTTQATTEATTEEATQVTMLAPSDCGPGYKLYPTGSCYKVHLQKVNWDEARATCASEGGYLAIINNEYEAQVVGTFAFLETDSNWITIGLRDYEEDGHWTSVHNDPIDQIYNVWAESRSNDRYCGSLKKVGGKVDDQYCRAVYPFICEQDHGETIEVTAQVTTEITTEVTTQATTEATTEETSQPTTVSQSDCGSGYKLYPTGSCYKVHLQKVYWDEAQATCTSEGGYLAVINNEYEAQVIGTFAFLETDSNWVTIGLRDYKEDGHWTSVHNDPIDQIYKVWAESKSNDRYCGSLKKVGGKLDDQYCRAVYPFVCERLVSS